MTAYATTEDLRLYLRLSTIDATAAGLLLDLAAAAIRTHLDQAVAAVVDETVTLYGNGSDLLLLPERPVTGVSAVVADGVTLTATTDYTWRPSGLLRRANGGLWPAEVTVTYSHGYTAGAEPEALRLVNVQAAGRVWVNPAAVTSETIGDWARSWSQGGSGTESGITLTAAERAVLDKVRP